MALLKSSLDLKKKNLQTQHLTEINYQPIRTPGHIQVFHCDTLCGTGLFIPHYIFLHFNFQSFHLYFAAKEEECFLMKCFIKLATRERMDPSLSHE